LDAVEDFFRLTGGGNMQELIVSGSLIRVQFVSSRHLHNGHLEGIKGVTILFVQGPSNSLIQLLEGNIVLLRNMTQN
jgi:hypothetical protein